jgi:hypothetical protein
MSYIRRLIGLACLASGILIAGVGGYFRADAQTTTQFPTSPWGGYATASIQCGELLGANFNVTTDQAIPISVPSGTWMIENIVITNPTNGSGSTLSMTTAQGGFYTAVSKGGVAVVASSQAYSTLTGNAANTTGNAMTATLATAGTTTAFGGYAAGSNQISTLYFSLTTPQGAAATADIRVRCRALY